MAVCNESASSNYQIQIRAQFGYWWSQYTLILNLLISCSCLLSICTANLSSLLISSRGIFYHLRGRNIIDSRLNIVFMLPSITLPPMYRQPPAPIRHAIPGVLYLQCAHPH